MAYLISVYKTIKEEKLLIALAVVFWLFLFLTTVSKIYSYFVRHDIVISLNFILLEAFLIWGLVAVFVPLYIWLAKKNPIEADKRFRNAGIHILMSLFLVPVHALFLEGSLYFVDYHLINEQLPFQWGTLGSFLGTITWIGLVVSFSYWLVVGGWHFTKNYAQFKERELKNIELEAELSTIRLRVLRSQLHPHFLFNTLHSVHSLIHEDVKTAEEMLRLLKRFLQISIQRVDEQQVSFADEIEFTEVYLEIEKTRFSDRLRIQKNIDAEVLGFRVPSLMLQPLVENAIRHGISNKRGPGMLSITAQKLGSFLEIVIEDDGPGLNKKTMNSAGIGLNNISQRLENLYKDSVFELGYSSLGGLKVTIKVPLTHSSQLVQDHD